MDECQNVITFDDLDSVDIEDAKDDNMVTIFYKITYYSMLYDFMSVGSPSCILIFGFGIILNLKISFPDFKINFHWYRLGST